MNEHLKIGNLLIDEQHIALYHSLQRLAAIPDTVENAETISDHFDRLSGLLRIHFADEESFMDSLEVPDHLLGPHLAAHYDILNELTNVHFMAMTGERPSLWHLCNQVARWIIDHISEFDVQLRPYIEATKES